MNNIYIVTLYTPRDESLDEEIIGVYDNEEAAKSHSEEVNKYWVAKVEQYLPKTFEEFRLKYPNSDIITEDKFTKWRKGRLQDPDKFSHYDMYEINKRVNE